MLYYILNAAGEPTLCDDRATWLAWLERVEQDKSHIFKTTVLEKYTITTCFIGMDAEHITAALKSDLKLWATFVDTPPYGGSVERYASREEAEKDHDRIVRRVLQCDQCGLIHASLDCGEVENYWPVVFREEDEVG